jgi:hypothetical protein
MQIQSGRTVPVPVHLKYAKKKLLLIRMHKSGWYQVGRVLVPRFLAACPHPVTLAGMLIMSNSYLPTSSAWEK